MRRSRSGFTLIEVIIAIVLVGVMASFFFPRIGQALRRQDVASARNAVTTLLAKARQTAVQRGRAVAFIQRSNTVIILANHPVTGAIDTVDRQDMNVRFGVSMSTTRDSIAFDSRGLAMSGSNSWVYVTKSGFADTIEISAVGGVIR